MKKPLAFLAMPFGKRDGIDFERVGAEYLVPALEQAGFEVARADDERRAGEIRTDMFQALLSADLVVAELTLDNPNVWYELGVRHALRARGVVQVIAKGRRDRRPFDVYSDRTVSYSLENAPAGLTGFVGPDPAQRESDVAYLKSFVEETMKSWAGRRHSPVYQLLPALVEPTQDALKVTDTEAGAGYLDWLRRVDLARNRKAVGDVLLLADEAPSALLRADALCYAARALLDLKSYEYARSELKKALAAVPFHRESQNLLAVTLGRLAHAEEAESLAQQVIERDPQDFESHALLGRIRKERWLSQWNQEDSLEKRRASALEASWILEASIDSYVAGFETQPSAFYPGINAALLLHLLDDLNGVEPTLRTRQVTGGVRWAIQAARARSPAGYWAAVSAAEVELLEGDEKSVRRAYGEAMKGAGRWFQVDSSLQEVELLGRIGFQPARVEVARSVLSAALKRFSPPAAPGRIFLFSGHMLDAPGRNPPRFPESKVPAAIAAIEQHLDQLHAEPGDTALSGGAHGGDLLFVEACLRRGMHVEMHIQSDEETYLSKSVISAGPAWLERFYAARAHATLLVMPDEVGLGPPGINEYERANHWMLYCALGQGPERVHAILLWDKQGGDGPGGTADMKRRLDAHGASAYVIDPTTLPATRPG